MASLTTKTRKALPTSQFAIPAQKAYPIDTAARARAALARVAANGTPAEKKKVIAAVERRYPSMKVSK